MTATTPPQLLDQALLRDPARPLITFYDDATDERTELSVATFGNWVAKTANLLQDDLAAEPGTRVALHLPVHWQSAVWLAACWAVGAVAHPGATDADVTVTTAEGTPPGPGTGDTVVLGLGPLGLPVPGRTPPAPPALDYDAEIHGHADRFLPHTPPRPQAAALVTSGGSFTAADLADLAVRTAPEWGLQEGSRVLTTRPLDEPSAVLAALLVPLAAGVTSVLCRHLDESRLTGRVEAEHVTAVTGLSDAVSGVRRI